MKIKMFHSLKNRYNYLLVTLVTFIRKKLLFLVALIGLSIQSLAQSPNILFIIGDDMGVDAISGFNTGIHHPNTPTLDKIRENGLTFTNVWAAPVCSASRASLLTGKYGLHNGVSSVPGFLSTEHKSIFKEIDEQSGGGYSNCLIGKWHLAKQNNYNHPFEHGVQEFMGVLGAGVDDYYKWLKYEDGKTDTCSTYVTKYFTDYAIDWIKKQNKPWFLWMAEVSPHTPLHVPPEETYTINNTDDNKRKYKAMIESMDYEIGRLLDSIPSDVLDNTILVFLGDNGTPGNLLSEFPKGRGKSTLYQGGIHVPLIISGKGVSRKNETENAMINVSDFYVTFAQLVNPDAYPADSVFDSYSFKHLLDGSEGRNRSYNYMELGPNTNVPKHQYTVRNEQYKLLDLGDGTLGFYNLKADTFELNNLLASTLSSEQETAKDHLFNLMAEIRGETPYVKPPETSQRGKAGKYPVVHTGVSAFYDTNSEISTPAQSDILFWQDAGRVKNTPSYSDNGDNTITDNITGLVWQKFMGEKMTFEEAVIKADTMQLGAYNDWRIPTIKELYSLIQFNGRVMGENAITPFIDTDYFNQPIGNVSIGEREIDAQVWSKTFYSGLTMNSDTTIFGVNFIDGRIKGYPKFKKQSGEANKMYFRMVRGNTDYGNNLFIAHNDGTVTDSATYLMWQQADDGVARDWLSSIQYCENLILAGYDDWHLPNAKELQSIVDYKRSPSATNSAAIDSVFDTSEINDPEGNPGHYPFFWSTTTHPDGPNPYDAAVYIAFGKALGEMNGNLLDVHGAGAQRSDPKTGNEADYPKYHGPQGDLQMVYNHCRCVRVLDDVTAIKEMQEPTRTFMVYPNPANKYLKIESAQGNAADIRIYNMSGALVHHTSNQNRIDISEFEAGAYIIQVGQDRKVFLVSPNSQ